MADELKVFVVEVTHKHGSDLFINKTEAGAYRALYEYVAASWDSENWDGHLGELPEDQSEAIKKYFEDNEHENWDCTWYTVGE